MISKGEILALLIAKAFEGSVGPFGGEDPELNGSTIGLYSQMGTTYYTFGDEGTVDIDFDQSAIKNLKYEGVDVFEDIERHWDNLLDFLQSDDGWFMEFKYDHPKIFEAIKAVLAI